MEVLGEVPVDVWGRGAGMEETGLITQSIGAAGRSTKAKTESGH